MVDYYEINNHWHRAEHDGVLGWVSGAYVNLNRLVLTNQKPCTNIAKNLAVALTRVSDLKDKDLPKMLVPFDKDEMEDFFLEVARSLEKDIFR